MKTAHGTGIASGLAMLVLMLLLAGCERTAQQASPPPPAEVSDEATGYYCGMLLADHAGPKGQIHLASRKEPLWFSSVRDAIAFLRLPEEASDVVAVYVNDMGKARNWEQPEVGTWVDARTAWFVVDSTMRGGMGAPEAVPFATQAAAEAFRASHGGRVVQLDEIPDDYVLGPVDLASPDMGASGTDAAMPVDGDAPTAGDRPKDAEDHSEHHDH